MTRRIWTKPFIKYNLSGDRTIAKSLERRARACVGYLFDQLMPNQKFRSQNWNYADGSRITAYVWRDVLGERARVEVFAAGGRTVLSSCYLESGWLVFEDNEVSGRYIESFGEEPVIYVGERNLSSGPKLDAKRSYLSKNKDRDKGDEFHKFDARDRPELYSGLTRLLVQALISRGRTLDEVFPTDWYSLLSDEYPGGIWNEIRKRLGCIRDPKGRYWLVFVSKSEGVQMCRLLTDAASGNNIKEIEDACRLGASRLPEDIDIVTVIESTDTNFTDFHAEEYELDSWGWCWRYQKRGSADENVCGAIGGLAKKVEWLDPLHYNDPLLIRHATISIEFPGDVPVGTFIFDPDDEVDVMTSIYINGIDHISYCTIAELYPNRQRSIPLTEPKPVLAYYDSSGDLVTIDFVLKNDEVLLREHYSHDGCGTSVNAEIYVKEKIIQAYSAFYVSREPVVPIEYRTTYEKESMFTESMVQTSISGPYGSTYLGGLLGCDGQYFAAGDYLTWLMHCDRQRTKTFNYVLNTGGPQKLIISDIPGCCWILQHRPTQRRQSSFNTGDYTPNYTNYMGLGDSPQWLFYSFDAYDPFGEGSFTNIPINEPHLVFVVNDTERQLFESGYEEIVEWDGDIGFQPAKSGYNDIRESFPMESKLLIEEAHKIGRVIGAA